MPVFSKLESLPKELLEKISLCAIESSFLGPPTMITTLLRVSKNISIKLGRKNNPYLYAHICCHKFDIRQAVKRLARDSFCAMELADELVRRCNGMTRLRRNTYSRPVDGDVLDDVLRVDLWMAYLMFLENDCKNAMQLIQYAHIDKLATEFVKPGGRLHDGALENGGWTVDNETNALGLWLFWFTDKDRVKLESATERDDILDALGCLFTGSFKYACTHVPLTFFNIPPANLFPICSPSRSSTISLATSPFSPPCTVPCHFGRKLNLMQPLPTLPALLSCILRLGHGGGAPIRSPATRAEALQVGWIGPTHEDYKAISLGIQGVEWGEEETSRKYDHDWSRLMVGYNVNGQPSGGFTVFTPGILDGLWDGRWLAVPPDYFQTLLSNAQQQEPIGAHLSPPVFQKPMQFRLREHHQYDAERMVPFDDQTTDGDAAGALRAWLPDGLTTTECDGQLRMYNPCMETSYTYLTYNPLQDILDDELPATSQILDIILTAQTSEEFGDVWGHDHYVGRVRQWDGLVVLVRTARPDAGRWIFRGYIHGEQNLVGRWRETATPVNRPGWEGVWIMEKRPDE